MSNRSNIFFSARIIHSLLTNSSASYIFQSDWIYWRGIMAEKIEGFLSVRPNWNEIGCDIALLLSAASLIFRDKALPQTHLLQSPLLLCISYALVSFCLPFYMGQICSTYLETQSRIVKRLVTATFLLVSLMTFISTTFAISAHAKEIGENASIFLISLACVLMILGSIAGLAVPSEPEEGKDPDQTGMAIFALILGVGLMIFLLVFKPFYHGSSKIGEFLYFLCAFIGGPLVGAVGMGLVIYIKDALVAKGIFPWINKAMQILYPIIIAGSLSIFNQIILGMVDHFINIRQASPLAIFLALLISGLIPFRLALFLLPPVRLLNVLTGITVFGFYIYSLIF